LEESIDDGMINITSFASKIRAEVSRKIGRLATGGAIVMAIQRHQPGKLVAIKIRSGNLLKNLSNIIVRSDISVFKYENSSTLPERLVKVSGLLSKKRGCFTLSRMVYLKRQ